MQEYKREKATLEAKLKEISKSASFHNDHLRVIDAWFKQVSIRVFGRGVITCRRGGVSDICVT
jgi:hypothetical protein